MRYRKVLLVRPRTLDGTDLIAKDPPISLGYLSEFLHMKKIDCDVFDMSLGYGIDDLKEKIRDSKPDLIGFELISALSYKNNLKIISIIKKIFNIHIVVGGPYVSTLRNELLDLCKAIDYAIILEGEHALVELMQGKELKDIQGLVFRDNKKIIYTGDRPFIKDLDSLPFPKYRKFDLSKYPWKRMLILSSRGCPYNCTYCGVKLAIGRMFRFRSPENIVDEIEYWYKKGYNEFNLIDDNFTLLSDRVYEFCELLEKKGFKNLRLGCPNGVRADKVDRNLLIKMKKVGFYYLSFGVEAGNNKVLKAIRKGEKIETIERAIKEACELGFDVNLLFLVGSPSETWEDIMDSAKLALKYPIINASFNNLIPFPHTELFDYVKANNLFLREPEAYLNDAYQFSDDPYFYTPELSADERKRAIKYLKKVSRKIVVNHFKRKMKKFGIIGSIFVLLYSTFYTENLRNFVRRNKFLFWITEKITLGFKLG